MQKKIAMNLSVRQAEQLLDQLSPAVKIHLVRRWQKQTWPDRFQQLLNRIDRRIRRNPALAREALKELRPNGQASHAGRRRH